MAAPKGNQFYRLAVKSLGRPRKYETFEELQSEIIAYFEEQKRLKNARYTVTGLTSFLGFVSRQDLYAQGERGQDFSYLINMAINIVASCYENHLYSVSPAGAIFVLKNIKSDEFKDKTEIDQRLMSIEWKEEKTYETEQKANDSD
ncbi:MAG TPA: terminase small subunit [Tenuifilaceae bacterium]|nr:terminase small subunit [Tenuifilaceae bacterium]